MSSNNINQEVTFLIKSKQEVNKFQEFYKGLQSDWSEHLSQLIGQLLGKKQKAYKPGSSDSNGVRWNEESELFLTELYKGVQKVESGFTNLGEYKNMSKEEADLMMEKYSLKEVRSDLKDEEDNMNFFLKNSLLPKIDAYKTATKSVRAALLKNAIRLGSEAYAKKVTESCLFFLSILNPNLVATEEHKLSDTRFSVDRMWDISIRICQDLKEDIGDRFKTEVVKAVVNILVKTPHQWSDGVFKYVVANTSSVFCIETSEDIEVVIEGAYVQQFLINNKAAIEGGQLTMGDLVKEFKWLEKGQQEPPPEQSKEDRLRFGQLRLRYLRTEVLMADMQKNEQTLQNNANLAGFIASQETIFASDRSKELEEWVESNETETIVSMLEDVVA